MYSNPESYKLITYENTLDIKRELAPLIEPEDDNAIALRFDALMYGIELAYLMNKKDGRRYKDLKDKVKSISKIANIPEIIEQKDIINKILNTDYLNDDIGINKFEDIRERLRNLMKYIPKSQMIFETDFNDEILSKTWNESDLENDDLKNYKEKEEYYIRQHQNEKVISKIKTNQPLTTDDIKDLERILWNELGTQEDYKKEYKDLYMPKTKLKTLTTFLMNYAGAQQGSWPTLAAAIIVVLIPTVVLYLIFHKQITEGLSAGATKE